ncbi:MAG: hypothetical protein JXA97_10680 [Anaerolineales bacterium]|nr:hypothetical protein [Anaerolineales bacterium]
MDCRRALAVVLLAAILSGCILSPHKPEYPPTQVDEGAASPGAAEPLAPAPMSTEPGLPAQFSPQAPDWRSLPVVPELSSTALAIYARGQELGYRANAFSKIGDGEIATTWFLPLTCNLGRHEELAAVYAYFSGSFARASAAAQAGFNTDRILDPAFADATVCESGESPLACEVRIHRPAFALISLGTNQVWQPDAFEEGLERIIIALIDAGVVPVLSTKGDNLEGDGSINAIIADLAGTYDLPLWNFWAGIQGLPGDGLQPDGEHLTWAHCDFGDAGAMLYAWPVRNLTALQVLQALMQAVPAVP